MVSEFLIRAVQWAHDNVTQGGRPFGAVVVRDGAVLSEGVNTTALDHDPSAHAELVAIKASCQQLGEPRLDGATVYASCEPCVMCQALALNIGVAAMEFAVTAEDAAAAGWPYPPDALRLQGVWRTATTGFAAPVHTDGALEPFELWASRS